MPSVGGKRAGAGRKAGAATRATREAAERVLASGELTPLDYMLGVMRDDTQSSDRRDDMAKAAAPFVHARLQAVDATVKATVSLGDLLDAAARG